MDPDSGPRPAHTRMGVAVGGNARKGTLLSHPDTETRMPGTTEA